jgi:thiamine-monophosphate kinase
MNEKKPVKIAELGEFGLIDHITKDFATDKRIIKGIGDDAAVLSNDEDSTVISTDILVEGIHFDLIYTPLKHLGYKSVVVNLSDIYAMNCIPVAITVSIALSNKFSLHAIEELYEGVKLACEKYNVNLVGGDTSSSVTGLMISVTAIGQSSKGNIVFRDGAQKTDLICVSGNLGAAYLGLQILEREKVIFLNDNKIQPDLKGFDYILQRQLKPEARNDIIEILSEKKIKPTSMIDISDGLSSELLHICKQSATGCRIYQDKIPLHPDTLSVAERFNMDPLTPALNGGEDYELLFTVPLSKLDEINKIEQISIIGYICEESENCALITESGTEIELLAQGWNQIKDE